MFNDPKFFRFDFGSRGQQFRITRRSFIEMPRDYIDCFLLAVVKKICKRRE